MVGDSKAIRADPGPISCLHRLAIEENRHQLLDRHEKAYSGEISRMDAHLTRLLNHILGPQPSSTEMATIPELIADAEGKTEIEEKSEGDQP